MKSHSEPDDPRFIAAVDLLRRTGLQQFQIRYCAEEKPVVWIAAGLWKGNHWEAGGGMNPTIAVFHLAEAAIDGGHCRHCHRPTGFEPSAESMPLNNLVCWYQYDPSTQKFARGCAE